VLEHSSRCQTIRLADLLIRNHPFVILKNNHLQDEEDVVGFPGRLLFEQSVVVPTYEHKLILQ
jgi:hypothetical protein